MRPHHRTRWVLTQRSVYYRPYCLDGAIPSKRAYPGGSPFVGRIKATSIPPPHSVASLKRALVQAEELPDPTGELTGIFQSIDARNAMVAARVVLLTGELGATPDAALALVFHAELPTATTQISSSSFNDSAPGMSSKYRESAFRSAQCR
jgi:hypothetical protein